VSINVEINMEKEVIINAINGDRKSIETIVVIYQPRVFGFVRSKINNLMDVEEIVQEVFVSCFINIILIL